MDTTNGTRRIVSRRTIVRYILPTAKLYDTAMSSVSFELLSLFPAYRRIHQRKTRVQNLRWRLHLRDDTNWERVRERWAKGGKGREKRRLCSSLMDKTVVITLEGTNCDSGKDRWWINTDIRHCPLVFPVSYYTSLNIWRNTCPFRKIQLQKADVVQDGQKYCLREASTFHKPLT